MERKETSLGLSNTTDSAFAEILPHSLRDENRMKVSTKEVCCDHDIMLMVMRLCCFARVVLYGVFIIPYTCQFSSYFFFLFAFFVRVGVATLVLRPSTSISIHWAL